MPDGMAGKFVGGAIALVIGVALIPTLANFVGNEDTKGGELIQCLMEWPDDLSAVQSLLCLE